MSEIDFLQQQVHAGPHRIAAIPALTACLHAECPVGHGTAVCQGLAARRDLPRTLHACMQASISIVPGPDPDPDPGQTNPIHEYTSKYAGKGGRGLPVRRIAKVRYACLHACTWLGGLTFGWHLVDWAPDHRSTRVPVRARAQISALACWQCHHGQRRAEADRLHQLAVWIPIQDLSLTQVGWGCGRRLSCCVTLYRTLSQKAIRQER